MPLQWNVEENGLQDSMFVIRKLQVNEPLNEADLTIPGEIRNKYHPDPKSADLENRPLGAPGQPAQELEPGIVLIPGAWNATFIKQDDGIVILEAPISSGYSAKVIAEAKNAFPVYQSKPLSQLPTRGLTLPGFVNMWPKAYRFTRWS